MRGRGRASRALGLLTLAAFLGGCTTYRTVAVPNPAVEAHADEPVRVAPGDDARVWLNDGSHRVGEVAAVNETAIILAGVDGSGYFERPIPFAKISHVEVRRPEAGASAVLAAVIVMTGALVYGLLSSGGEFAPGK